MEIMRLRHIATVMNSNVDKVVDPDEVSVRLCNYVHVYKNDFITTEIEFDNGSATEAEIKRFGLRVGDVIITKDSEDRHDIGVPAYVRDTAVDLVCGYHLTILRAFKTKCRGDFLFWALQLKGVQEAFAVAASGVTRYGLGQEGIKGLSLHLPDLATQKQIADFLDAETTRIDALIEKKQRISNVLMANRMDAVLRVYERFNGPTMQITPETYATGIRADGWSVRRVKHVISFMTSGSRGWSDLIADEGELFLQSGNIGRSMEIVLDTAQRIQPQTGAEAKRTRLQPKDVLVCITGGRTGAVGYLDQIAEPAYINQHVCLLRARPALMEPKLLAHVLYSRIGQKQLDFFQYGLKQGLGFSQVGEVRVPVPPRNLQQEILREIDQALMKIDKLLDRQSASITKLREYRAALITATVTGQIDVAVQASPVETLSRRAAADVVQLQTNPQPSPLRDRRTVRVLVAAEVVHRLGADPYLGRTKLQKLMFLAEAHANINDIGGRYQRYRYGPYDDAMVQEIEQGLRQDGYYDTKEAAGADREKVAFQQMSRAGGHRDAIAAALGDKTERLLQLVDLFKGKDTAATEAVATLYAVWNDALIDGQQPDDAAIIRGFLQDWHPEKGKFKQADLQTWLDWMRRHGIIPQGSGPHTISTITLSLFESE